MSNVPAEVSAYFSKIAKDSKDDVRGQQLDTGVVGRLDLLAVDKDGALVVIELKVRGAGPAVAHVKGVPGGLHVQHGGYRRHIRNGWEVTTCGVRMLAGSIM